MHQVCAAGFRHLSHDAVEPVFSGLTRLSAVDIPDRLLERPLDEPIRCVDVSQQKARRKSQFGQKREDVVGRVRSGGARPDSCGGKSALNTAWLPEDFRRLLA